jgi:hypothetical protein
VPHIYYRVVVVAWMHTDISHLSWSSDLVAVYPISTKSHGKKQPPSVIACDLNLPITYSLRSIILFVNIDVFRHILIIDTSVLAKSNIGRREYNGTRRDIWYEHGRQFGAGIRNASVWRSMKRRNELDWSSWSPSPWIDPIKSSIDRSILRMQLDGGRHADGEWTNAYSNTSIGDSGLIICLWSPASWDDSRPFYSCFMTREQCYVSVKIETHDIDGGLVGWRNVSSVQQRLHPCT